MRLPSSRRTRQDAPISTRRVGRVVGNLADTAARLNAGITRALEHASIRRRVQCLENIAKGVEDISNSLALCDRLIDSNKPLDKAAILRERIVEGVGNINGTQIRLDRLVGRQHVQVHHDAVDKIDGAINQTRIPHLGLAHLNRDTRHFIAHKRRLDGPGLTGINLQRIGLQQLGEALDIGQSEVGIAPQRRLAAGAGRVQVDADVDLGRVAPEIVPDVVGEQLRAAAAVDGGGTREDAVRVYQGPGGARREVVALVHVDAQRVYRRDADDCRQGLVGNNLPMMIFFWGVWSGGGRDWRRRRNAYPFH
jgi:hypothetical protein